MYVRDEYGGEQIRVRPLDEQAAHQLAKVGKIDVALGPRALEPDLVRPVRVEEDAEEEDVEQARAPRRRRDGDVAVQPRRLGPVVVPLADDLDLDHDARDVPGERGEDRVLPLAVGYAYSIQSVVLSENTGIFLFFSLWGKTYI